jgi:hypothetical protein
LELCPFTLKPGIINAIVLYFGARHKTILNIQYLFEFQARTLFFISLSEEYRVILNLFEEITPLVNVFTLLTAQAV